MTQEHYYLAQTIINIIVLVIIAVCGIASLIILRRAGRR